MADVHLRMSDPTVREIVQATFPSFKGREVVARVEETVRLYGTLWDEGNKRDYALFSLSTGRVVPIPQEPYGQRSDLHEREIRLEPGLVVACLHHFRGREYMEIITSPANVQALLPAPVDVTDDEKTVLIATRSLKSSYGGVKDYRFFEARRRRGITRERWEAAVASLKARRLLNAAGAITTEGRNVAGTAQL